jgi:hypothetical protein
MDFGLLQLNKPLFHDNWGVNWRTLDLEGEVEHGSESHWIWMSMYLSLQNISLI